MVVGVIRDHRRLRVASWQHMDEMAILRRLARYCTGYFHRTGEHLQFSSNMISFLWNAPLCSIPSLDAFAFILQFRIQSELLLFFCAYNALHSSESQHDFSQFFNPFVYLLQLVCDRKLYGRNNGRYNGRKAYGRNVSALFLFRSHQHG